MQGELLYGSQDSGVVGGILESVGITGKRVPVKRFVFDQVNGRVETISMSVRFKENLTKINFLILRRKELEKS